MTTVAYSPDQEITEQKVIYKTVASPSPVYAFGMIGALVYYLQRANTFQAGVLGFFKAMFWPAILVYEILKLLNTPANTDN